MVDKRFVEDALKERELEVTTAKAMQDALATLHDERVTQERADAAALTLATTGKASILLLLNEDNIGSSDAAIAAEKALPLLDFTHHNELCKELAYVVGNSSATFRLTTTEFAVKNIRTSNCMDDLPVLRSLQSSLKEGDDKIITLFRVPPDHAGIERLRAEVQNAIDKLASTSTTP